MSGPQRMREYSGVDRALFEREIASRYEPAVLRGLVSDWPAVEAASASPEAARDYVLRFDRGEPVQASVAPAEIGGRFFYGPGLLGFNFGMVRSRVGDIADRILDETGTQPPLSIYMASEPISRILPGWSGDNRLPDLGFPADPRIWIGSATKVAPHFDTMENVACVVAGRRRFTLFPPEQVDNLYIGPLERTIAGTPIGLVDVTDPDFEAFPRFRDALDAALVADLEPGDAIYMPPLWWHHVEAFGRFNILVNYWWDEAPADAGSPLHALGHALLSISQLPPEQRAAWRAMFDHYVFRRDPDPAAHMPEAARGILGESTPELRRMIRQFLIRSLSQP